MTNQTKEAFTNSGIGLIRQTARLVLFTKCYDNTFMAVKTIKQNHTLTFESMCPIYS